MSGCQRSHSSWNWMEGTRCSTTVRSPFARCWTDHPHPGACQATFKIRFVLNLIRTRDWICLLPLAGFRDQLVLHPLEVRAHGHGREGHLGDGVIGGVDRGDDGGGLPFVDDPLGQVHAAHDGRQYHDGPEHPGSDKSGLPATTTLTRRTYLSKGCLSSSVTYFGPWRVVLSLNSLIWLLTQILSRLLLVILSTFLRLLVLLLVDHTFILTMIKLILRLVNPRNYLGTGVVSFRHQ